MSAVSIVELPPLGAALWALRPPAARPEDDLPVEAEALTEGTQELPVVAAVDAPTELIVTPTVDELDAPLASLGDLIPALIADALDAELAVAQ
ncbi:hypothetical protein ABT336_00390 [Micromonospora sp. NPDC000207]|uniref:hypothetical protein n=1 Tax=Micromonospora sp. NPDC000207 TaxID=3154246 RepID=UPI00332859E1